MGVGCVAEAAAKNNKTAFDLFLKNGFDLNQKGPNGKTVLEYLVEQRISVDPEIMGRIQAATKPSLFVLVQNGNSDGLKKALEDKENLAAINKPIPSSSAGSAGKPLLEYALPTNGFPHTETVKTLLAAGAEFKAKDIGGLMLYKHEYLLPLFWEYRDRMSEEDWQECFRKAATYRNVDAFKFFLEKGFDPEKVISAVYGQGTLEMVKMLEECGIKKPFWAAVKWNDLDLAKEYLAAGTDVNAEDKTTHHPPIYNAVEKNHLEMAELLIKNGANTSPNGYREWEYPMEAAATLKNGAKMTELLLKNGFVPDYPKTPGDTKHPNGSFALYRALYEKNYETARILLKYGARTDLTEETEIYDREQRKTVKIDAKLEELFKDDPKALEVLGKKKGFFDF